MNQNSLGQQPMNQGPSAQATFTGAAPNNQRQVITDEELKRMMKANEPSFMEKYGYCLVTLILIAINCVVYAVEVILSGFNTSVSTMVLYQMGAMFAPALQTPVDWWRFVAPMFLHVDLMHLLFNMAALYSAGVMLERFLGRWNFLLLYFVAGISGNVLSFAVDTLSGNYYVSAGASTSIFGLFVAMALLGVLSKRNRYFYKQYSKGMLAVIGINIVYTLLAPSVSVSGHIGGALGGLVAMFMIPSKNLRVPNVVRIIVSLAWLAAVAHVACTFLPWWPPF